MSVLAACPVTQAARAGRLRGRPVVVVEVIEPPAMTLFDRPTPRAATCVVAVPTVEDAWAYACAPVVAADHVVRRFVVDTRAGEPVELRP